MIQNNNNIWTVTRVLYLPKELDYILIIPFTREKAYLISENGAFKGIVIK